MEQKKGKKKKWKLDFDPDQLQMEHGELKMADFALSHDELKSYAIECSKLREQIRQKAIQIERTSFSQSN